MPIMGDGMKPPTVVGADGGLAAVMERAQQVAKADAPVLLLGETGSEKK